MTWLLHGGLVGVNHYQVAKAASVAARAVKKGGYVIVVADTVDSDPVGGECYRGLMALLKTIGPEALDRLIQSADWTFVADQWQVQMWARVFRWIPSGNLFYFSPQMSTEDYRLLPCADVGSVRVGLDGLARGRQVSEFVERAVSVACERSLADTGAKPKIAYLPAGPYGIPVSGGQ